VSLQEQAQHPNGTDERTWYERFYDAIEAKDIEATKAQMTPDTSLRIANRPAVDGLDDVVEATLHFWDMIGSMKHSFETVVESGDVTMFESMVEYVRLDGRHVTLPAATAIVRRDGLVAAQRVYVDTHPLFDE
jgi:ketosteroid isomerase-like protein